MRSSEATNQFGYPDIPETRRRLMLDVFAGAVPQMREITVAMHFLDCHFPAHKLDAALTWLIRNHITGVRFHDFLVDDCGGSYLILQKILLAKIEKEKHLSPLIAGKDFRL